MHSDKGDPSSPIQADRAPIGTAPTGLPFKRKRRPGGMTWILIVIAILFALGWALSALKKGNPSPVRRPAAAVERYAFGVDDFKNVDGGVSFDVVDPPGGPADNAGLIGGDIITSFDGQAVKDKDQMVNLLRQEAVGKIVEIVYLRDGEKRRTQLTTISYDERRKLAEAFENRAAGQGQLGFDDHNVQTVSVTGTSIRGVQLNSISPSGPAALAGIHDGDVVIEFEGTPIRTVPELALRVRRAIPYASVKVIVMRDSERIEIPVKMGRRR
jgi:S1-C subfamily serine protease